MVLKIFLTSLVLVPVLASAQVATTAPFDAVGMNWWGWVLLAAVLILAIIIIAWLMREK